MGGAGARRCIDNLERPVAARILIIEHDTASLQLMAGLLAARGHTPLTMRAAPIDLVLCGQPGTGNLAELFSQLKGDPALGNPPLLAVVEDGAAALQAGFAGYIGRPIEPDSFADEVEAFLPQDASVTGTLLLVDDDAFMLEMLADFLAPEGYRIHKAGSAREALALLGREAVDVILSDQWMPDVTGLELMQQAARLYPHTARLMLSAHAETGEIARAVEEGTVDRYYTKPWAGAELRDGIRAAFRLRRARGG